MRSEALKEREKKDGEGKSTCAQERIRWERKQLIDKDV